MRVASFRYETSYRWNIWSDNGGDWWKSMALIRWIMAWSRCEIEVAHDRDNACTNTFGWRFTRCNNRVDDGSNWICVKAIEVNWKQKRGGGERIDRVFFLLFPFFFSFYRFQRATRFSRFQWLPVILNGFGKNSWPIKGC